MLTPAFPYRMVNGMPQVPINFPITWSICAFSYVVGSAFMSGSSFMSLPKPWNIAIKADHLSWDMLFHCSR